MNWKSILIDVQNYFLNKNQMVIKIQSVIRMFVSKRRVKRMLLEKKKPKLYLFYYYYLEERKILLLLKFKHYGEDILGEELLDY